MEAPKTPEEEAERQFQAFREARAKRVRAEAEQPDIEIFSAESLTGFFDAPAEETSFGNVRDTIVVPRKPSFAPFLSSQFSIRPKEVTLIIVDSHNREVGQREVPMPPRSPLLK